MSFDGPDNAVAGLNGALWFTPERGRACTPTAGSVPSRGARASAFRKAACGPRFGWGHRWEARRVFACNYFRGGFLPG